MNITRNGGNEKFCLVIEGAMTHRRLREMEDRIIDSMRHFPYFDVDLSGVSEVDHFGIRLLEFIRSIGDDLIHIVAASPVVEEVLSRISSSRPVAARGQAARFGERSFLPPPKLRSSPAFVCNDDF